MKISFSTLACPDWNLQQALDAAVRAGYDGLELRFLEGEDSLWKLPAFRGAGLRETCKCVADSGLRICCVDTSCRFDSQERSEREHWIDEGMRMADLAAQLSAPGIRVFGDRIQPGSSREVTRGWIVDSVNVLAEEIAISGVEVWLETHGDFSCTSEVQAILADCPRLRVLWDPVSAFVECEEHPLRNGSELGPAIRHVHIKDIRMVNEKWVPILTGSGEFPMGEMRRALDAIQYDGFLSFEWEKKWHPEIDPPEIAIPHFAEWLRKTWGSNAAHSESASISGVLS